MNTITFRTVAQASMFEKELFGQFSDGMWENTQPHDHWKFWSNLSVNVGENVGVIADAWCMKKNYGINRTDLLECVGDRMMSQAIMATFLGYIPIDDEVAEVLEGYFTWNGKAIVFTALDTPKTIFTKQNEIYNGVIEKVEEKIRTYEGYAKGTSQSFWNDRVEKLNFIKTVIIERHQELLNIIENYTYKNMMADLREIKKVMQTARW